MAAILAWVQANLWAVPLAVLVIFFALNPDKAKAVFEAIKSGQGASAIWDAIKGSSLLRGLKIADNEAHNIIGYAEMKVSSVRVVDVVSDADKEATAAAFTTILTNIAKAEIVPPDPVAKSARK
jgi:hypothetical protein